ncbi:hypothetical protein BKA18_004215 [Streptomyces auratus]
MSGCLPYVSPACHVGRHPGCTKGAPGAETAAAVPGVRRETCVCPCHAVGGGPGRHQPAGSPAGAEKTLPSGAAA